MAYMSIGIRDDAWYCTSEYKLSMMGAYIIIRYDTY